MWVDHDLSNIKHFLLKFKRCLWKCELNLKKKNNDKNFRRQVIGDLK